jgi:hypothetical protein
MINYREFCPDRLGWGLITVGFFSSLFGCNQQEQLPVADVPQYVEADIYRGLREQVLKQTYDKSTALNSEAKPIAVLMETGYPEAVATLMTASDGTASLYFSNGGGIIGGGEHEQVRATAESFLNMASTLANDMQSTEAYPLPREGSVRFYVVYENGVRTANAIEDDLGNMRHKLSPLFHKGHEVIAAVRENTPSPD